MLVALPLSTIVMCCIAFQDIVDLLCKRLRWRVVVIINWSLLNKVGFSLSRQTSRWFLCEFLLQIFSLFFVVILWCICTQYFPLLLGNASYSHLSFVFAYPKDSSICRTMFLLFQLFDSMSLPEVCFMYSGFRCNMKRQSQKPPNTVGPIAKHSLLHSKWWFRWFDETLTYATLALNTGAGQQNTKQTELRCQ